MRYYRRLVSWFFIAVAIPTIAVLYNRLTSATSPPSPLETERMSDTSNIENDVRRPKVQGHVVVVGAGLAGLCASYAALRAGASSVRLLERAAKPGGNSIKASSGINGAPTRWQTSSLTWPPHPTHGQSGKEEEKGEERVKDTYFFDDTIRSAGARLAALDRPPSERKAREALIAHLTNSSAAAIEFLTDEVGVDLSVVAQLGGHSFPRTHRGAGGTPPGAAIVFALLGRLKANPHFELITGCQVTKLIQSSISPLPASDGPEYQGPVVVGVEYTSTDAVSAGSEPTTRYSEGSVIFSTGGFAGDARGLLTVHREDLTGLPSTNEARPGAHSVLTAVGAKLIDMDSVQIHPTGFLDPAAPDAPVKFLAAEVLRGTGGVLLRAGKRFVNEMETREVVSRAIMAGPPLRLGDKSDQAGGTRQWDIQLLLDSGACSAVASHVGFYLSKGLLVKKKVRELNDTTRETLRRYSRSVTGEMNDEFGRSTFGQWTLGTQVGEGDDVIADAEVCVGRVTPVTHFTMGGVAFNKNAQVLASSLDEDVEKPIPGLWAAGEITGGIHGDNRLGGSSLLECVVYGLIAGEEAAKYALDGS